MDANKYISSKTFRDPSKVNIKPSLTGKSFALEKIQLGSFYFKREDAVRQSSDRVKYEWIFSNSKFEPPRDPNGTWSFDAEDKVIRREKVPGKDTPGDLRVAYKVLDAFQIKKEL